MATTNITLSDDNLLAEYVPLDKFKRVLEERLAVGPDTLAVLIRDGQIAEASAGAHFAIGGLWRTVKDAVGGRHALRLLIADLKPFQLVTGADSVTRDSVPVEGEFTIELQVNPEKPANVIGLMKEHTAVTKQSVLTRLSPHLGDRVLNSAVGRVDAMELRGNQGLQDKIQADAMKEVERIASDLGLLVRAVSMRWGFNEEEKSAIQKRRQDREQEGLEREFKILNRQVEREAESTILRLTTDLDIEKVEASTEGELRQLVLANELSFIDARETGIRIQQLKALEGELQLNRTQRLDGLKAQLEAEQHAIEMARLGGDKRGVARDIEKADRTHDVEVTRIGGDRRDVEMDIVRRERVHDLEVSRLRREISTVDLSVEDMTRRQALALHRLEEEDKLAIAAKAHQGQIAAMEGLNKVNFAAAEHQVDLDIKGGDAAHRRAMDAARLADDTLLSRIQMLKDASPEQTLAITAGFSAEVANVLVEQAKAKSAEGADRMALMREMVQQARDAGVASAAQANDLFKAGMQGTVGVAQGVGQAAAGRNRPGQGGADAEAGAGELVECLNPMCRAKMPATANFCRKCGRQMRQ